MPCLLDLILILTMMAGSQDKGLCSCRTAKTLWQYYLTTSNKAYEDRFLKPHLGVADIEAEIHAVIVWFDVLKPV
jgi:hypothetical protein